jgi:putative hydroxymethylpyrimidine transport system permease protein
MKSWRLILTAFGLLLGWHLLVQVTGVPRYILPGPLPVLERLWSDRSLLFFHAGLTALEIVLGLICGLLLGSLAAIALAASVTARRWLLPLLLISQAIPVFALAPLLVLWLGYGLASKIAMATLIIFFPVATAFHDGLRRTDPGWLDLARSMGAGRWALLWQIQVPAALPAFASGARIAAAVAPIGAVIGEWVGASAGLGYLMLHANGRLQTDLMFAALFILALLAVGLWSLTDHLCRHLLPWQPDTHPVSSV